MTQTTILEPKDTESTPQTPKWVPPVIFLDFDGVLILRDGECCPEAMHELNRLCLETGAAVVLTTSFRYSGSVQALHQKMLEKGFDKGVAVLGEVRDLSAYRAAEKRDDLMFQVAFERWSKGREIAAWLDEHPGATRYIVIDDQPQICAPYQKKTVVPVGTFGAGDRVRALQLLEDVLLVLCVILRYECLLYEWVKRGRGEALGVLGRAGQAGQQLWAKFRWV